MMLHGLAAWVPNMGASASLSCFHGLFSAGQQVEVVASHTGYPVTATVAAAYVSMHAAQATGRVVNRRVIVPVKDYVFTRIHELKTGTWIPVTVQAKAARLVFMNKTADRLLNPVRPAVKTAAKPLFVAFPDRGGSAYYMYIHAAAPPCEVRPIKVVGSSVEWEVVSQNLGAKPTVQSNVMEEKIIPSTMALSKPIAPRIDSSLTRSLIVVFQDVGGIKPIGFGVRVGRHEFVTAFHNVLQVGKSTPLHICSAARYEEDGEDVETHQLDLTTAVKALACKGRRSQTGFDSCIVSIPELTFAKSGISMYSNGLDHGSTGDVCAVGFAPQDTSDFKSLVQHCGSLIEMRCMTAVLGTVHHTISTVPGWSGTPVFRISGDTPKVTGLHIAAAPGKIPYNIAVSAPLLARLMSESAKLPKNFLNCPLTGVYDHVAVYEGDDDCPFDARLDETSTRTKMKRAEKDRVRAQYKKFKKVSGSRTSQRKRAKESAGPNKRHGGKTILARMSARDYEKLKQAASLLADNDQAREETKRVYRKILEIEDEIDYYQLQGDGQEGDVVEVARLTSKRDAILENFKAYAEMHARVSYRKLGQKVLDQFNAKPTGPPERRWANMIDSDDERDEDGFPEDSWNESFMAYRNAQEHHAGGAR